MPVITVDPEQATFEEAVAWFTTKLAMQPHDYGVLELYARTRAFTVSGMMRLELITQVSDSLEEAVRDGLTMDEWKAKIRSTIEAEWLATGGPTGAAAGFRLETIFRNNVLSAYSAGRYQQMTDPDVLADRPVWMYDAVLDGRTTEGCRDLDGHIAPHDDPIWETNYPPRHHRCRGGVRALTRDQADEYRRADPEVHDRAVTGVHAQEGWGARPRLGIPDLPAPSLADGYEPGALGVYQAQRDAFDRDQQNT